MVLTKRAIHVAVRALLPSHSNDAEASQSGVYASRGAGPYRYTNAAGSLFAKMRITICMLVSQHGQTIIIIMCASDVHRGHLPPAASHLALGSNGLELALSPCTSGAAGKGMAYARNGIESAQENSSNQATSRKRCEEKTNHIESQSFKSIPHT